MSGARSRLTVLVLALAAVGLLVFCTAGGGVAAPAPVSEHASVAVGSDFAYVDSDGPSASNGSSASDGPSASAGQTTSVDRSATTDGTTSQSGAETEGIELVQTLELTPDRPGSYDARSEYRLPEGLTSLEAEIPREATVVESRGFSAASDGRWVWDQSTDRPSLRLRMPANRTTDRDDPIAGPGDYLFADVGDWAIVQRPAMGHNWGWTGRDQVGFDRRLEAEQGVAGDVIAYLGEYETHSRTESGQTFTLVEPAAASLAESPDDVLDDLAYGSDALRIGDRDDEVLAIAAPTRGVTWGVRGLQTGPADIWVRDVEPLDDPHNVWLHEYVHARQDWSAGSSARWLTEATATYYGALLTLERGGIDFDQFARRLERGESPGFADARLSQPATWQEYPEYHLGSLTVGDVDRQLRLATGGERSFQDVLRALNDDSATIDAPIARTAVGDSGGDQIADLFQRLAETEERPQMWSQAEHETAFGTLPARIGYRLADGEDSLHVSSEYRDRSLGSDRTLVPGEQLAADVTVDNAGETSGDFEATMRFADERLAAEGGRLGPGESTTVSLTGTLSETGQGTLRVGDASYPITVREPATASVTALEVDRDEVVARDSVAVDVTLRNDASWPATRDLVLVANGRQLDATTVSLDASETRTVTRSVRLSSGGTYRIGARDSDVRSGEITVASDWRSLGTVIGLLLVVLVLALVAAQQRRRR